MDIILIAAVTLDGYIARSETDPMEWSQDLHLFKEQTMSYPLIMGSTTRSILQKELVGREIISVTRNDDPEKVIKSIKSDKCFIAGGGRTYARFAKFVTHIYLTIHPFAFGSGIKLFHHLEEEIKVRFVKRISVPGREGLYQDQYRVVI